MGSVISPAANLVLDRAEGVRRSGGDTGLYQELMAVFLADVPRLTQLVHVAIAEQSGPGLRLAAHSLRGYASQIGALAVADRASNLEAMVFGGLIVFFLIVEPHGLARLWQIGKEKLRLWPFPH